MMPSDDFSAHADRPFAVNRGRPGRVAGAAMLLTGDGSVPYGHRPSPSSWRRLPSLSIDAPHVLSDVAAVSARDVWVVGQAQGRPLAAHWDGTSWTVPLGPPSAPALIGAGLEGVTALRAGHETPGDGRGGGPDEVIAVGGAYDRLIGTEVPLIWRWDGITWATTPAPVLPGTFPTSGSTDDIRSSAAGGADSAAGYVLTGIAAVAPAEAWAVGHRSPHQGGGLVALHRRHGRWRPATGLLDVARGKLLAVSGTSPQDVWAVGAADRTGLIVHYDGRCWRRVRAPATRFPLTDVTALAPDDAWCTGSDGMLRWNGRRWSRVTIPIESATTVTALSATDVWAAGARGHLAHFDGRRWTRVTAPDDPREMTVWRSSATVHTGTGGPAIWMVGSRRLDEPTAGAGRRSFTVHSGEG